MEKTKENFGESLSLLLFPAILGDRTLFFFLAGLVALVGFFQVKRLPPFRIWILPAFFILISGFSFAFHNGIPVSLMERQITLVFIPILIWLSGLKVNRQSLHFIEISGGIFSIILIFNAILNFIFLKNSEFISYHGFAENVKFNAIYLSAYLCLSYFSHIQRWIVNGEKPKQPDILFFLSTFICLVLLSSKLILSLCLFLPFFYVLAKKSSIGLKLASFVALLFSLLIFSLLPVGKRVAFEFRETKKILELSHFDQGTYFTGTAIRLVLNRFSIEILREQNQIWTGLGMGNLQKKLDQKILQSGMYIGEPGKNGTGFLGYNTHNQYIHTLVENGILGLVGLLTVLGFMLVASFRNRCYLLVFQTILFLLLGLTENYMEVYFKGTLLFAFIFGLVATQLAENKIEEPIV